MMARLVVLAAASAVLACAGMPDSPREAFDEYMEAYADGDAERMWDLTTREARQDAGRLRNDLLAALTDPDPVRRIQVEGMFGAHSGVFGTMGDREFFIWAVAAIRRRLGGPFIRRTVTQWRYKSEGVVDGQVVVRYLEPPSLVHELPVRRVDAHWFVDRSPFPAESGAGAPPEPDPDDEPLRPGEEPWDPAVDGDSQDAPEQPPGD